MLLIEKMLKEHWEVREKSVTTTANSHISTAKNKETAIMLAAAPGLLRLLLKHTGETEEVLAQIKELFNSVK